MFVDRDESGNVKGVYACQQHDGQEELTDGAPEVLAFIDRPRRLAAEAASARALLIRRADTLAASSSTDDKLEALKIRLELTGG